jgi:hypothetical protein
MSFTSSFRNQGLKRTAIAAGAALVLAGSAVGVVGAQQPSLATPVPGTQAQQARPRHDQLIASIAGKLGVTVDRLNQAITETRAQLGLPQRGPGLFGHDGGDRRGGGGVGRGASLNACGEFMRPG